MKWRVSASSRKRRSSSCSAMLNNSYPLCCRRPHRRGIMDGIAHGEAFRPRGRLSLGERSGRSTRNHRERSRRMPADRIPGFRLGIYIFKDAEIVDFAAPYGVFSVARRFDPELDAFFVADALRPVQAQAGFTVLPNYAFNDRPDMNAFLIPGGAGTRPELHNGRLREFIRSLPESCLLVSVCTGSWIYGAMGLLDGLPATNRKEPDRQEAGPHGKVPIDRLAEIAP